MYFVAVCYTCDVYKPLCILLQCAVHAMFISFVYSVAVCCTCDVYKPFMFSVAVCYTCDVYILKPFVYSVAVCCTCDVYKPLCMLLPCAVHVMFINFCVFCCSVLYM